MSQENQYPYATFLNVMFPALTLVDVPQLVADCKDRWYNQTLCRVNGSVVRLGIMQGEYHWHKHDNWDKGLWDNDGMIEEVLEAWQVHDSLNLYLLERIPEEGLGAHTLLKNGQPSKGRDIRRVFAHIHDVRVSHIPSAFRQEATSFERGATPGQAELVAALQASGKAVEGLLRANLERDPRIKNRKSTGLRLLAYLISHESHHRGQIMLALKQTGVRVPEELRFGLWTSWFD